MSSQIILPFLPRAQHSIQGIKFTVQSGWWGFSVVSTERPVSQPLVNRACREFLSHLFTVFSTAGLVFFACILQNCSFIAQRIGINSQKELQNFQNCAISDRMILLQWFYYRGFSVREILHITEKFSEQKSMQDTKLC